MPKFVASRDQLFNLLLNLKNKKMKNLFFLLAFIVIAIVGYGQQVKSTLEASASEVAVLDWDTSTHDFGTVKQGTPVVHEFRFTNTGKIPLVITNVQASCGCTTPSWSKEPVQPGQTGFIKATYSAASVGAFDKPITVTANIERGTFVLKIKGEVTALPAVAQ
jgi:Protein of unknown function (DUF1573)